MKNFVKFEKAYNALKDAKKAIHSVSSYCISEYGQQTFAAKRRENVQGIDVAIEVLKDWFKEHFPKTRTDAFHSDQFTFTGFFEMLKKHRELANENESALKSLLADMKGGDLRTMGLEKIPDISEFI